MFHIDATFEDLRITATSEDGTIYNTTFVDNLEGLSRTIALPAEQLTMILAFNLHCDGEPEGYEKFYTVLEPIFKDWSNNLRPIP